MMNLSNTCKILLSKLRKMSTSTNWDINKFIIFCLKIVEISVKNKRHLKNATLFLFYVNNFYKKYNHFKLLI